MSRFGCPSSQIVDSPPSIRGYLQNVAGARKRCECLRDELSKLGARRVRTTEVKEKDWSEHWRKGFKARRIGSRVIVRPSWEETDSGPNDVVLVLDPGQAFGTGEHPTTRLCLGILQTLPLEGRRVLDLGCGSGILAIAANKLGAGEVVGSDIEPAAIGVARQNAKRNESDVRFELSDGFEESGLAGPWDLILSNITSAALCRLAFQASNQLRPGGLWLVSGILLDNWPDVAEAARRSGFELQFERQEDGWVGAVFARR